MHAVTATRYTSAASKGPATAGGGHNSYQMDPKLSQALAHAACVARSPQTPENHRVPILFIAAPPRAGISACPPAKYRRRGTEKPLARAPRPLPEVPARSRSTSPEASCGMTARRTQDLGCLPPSGGPFLPAPRFGFWTAGERSRVFVEAGTSRVHATRLWYVRTLRYVLASRSPSVS